jgi:hypothetical protein
MRLFWCLLTLVIAALSLGPSFAHVLEAPPRLAQWSPELWREATVFNGQFRFFALVGAPLDVGVILVTAIQTYLLRNEPLAFWIALCGSALFAVSLIVWWTWVAPANSVLATWKPGPIPTDFNTIRLRWETGHIVIASVKLAGFIAVCVAILISCLSQHRQ